jgi:thymidylate kinase
MKTKLLLFYGPGSGSGKSTLSRLIHDVLGQKGVKTKYIAESDVLHSEAFAPYVAEVQQSNPGDVKVLLSSCKHFINACSQSDQVYVVDSILPCTDWLVTAGCTRQQIRHFHTELNRLMTKLNPIQIFLTGDTNTFLKRAITDRGENWAVRLTQERCNSNDIQDLIAYFNEMKEVAFELLAEWQFKKIVLDTTKHDLPTCAKEIFRHLDLHGNLHMDICKASENA